MEDLIAKIQNHQTPFFSPAPVVAAAGIARRMLEQAGRIAESDVAYCFVAGDVTAADTAFFMATPRQRLERGLDYWIAADPHGPHVPGARITSALSALGYLGARVPGYEDELAALRASIEALL
ncbi:MAG: hypothetical protein ABSC25_10980 [Roseiarcus sp.]|jgi:acyl transferase domain-containing protein